MFRKFLPVFLLITCITISAQENQGTITGFIFDKNSDESLAGANIILEGKDLGAASQLTGYFELKAPFGIYTIKASFIGYESEKQVIQISKSHPVLKLEIKLKPVVLLEDQVTVTGDRIEASTVIQSIDAKDIQSMPNLHNDALRSVQVLAGVSSNNELSSGYNVRGGSFDENLIYLNGFEIYRPFLLRQGIEESQTLINQDLVSGMKFYNGAFPATYGDRMSSVLNVQYDVSKQETTTSSFHTDLFNLGASVKSRVGDFSFGAAARYAYPQLFSGSLQTKGDYNPTFSDFQFVIDYNISKRTKLETIGLYAQNKYTLKPEDWEGNFGGFARGDIRKLYIDYSGSKEYDYNTAMAGMRLTHKLSDDFILTASISDYYTNENEKQNVAAEIYYNEDPYADEGSEYLKSRIQRADNNLKLNSLRIKSDLIYDTENNLLTFGFEYRFDRLNNKVNEYLNEEGENTLLYLPQNTSFANSLNLDNFSIYANTELRITDNLIATAGLRFLRYNYSNENLISPRAQLLYIESNVNTFTFNWGYYYQPPFISELRGVQDIQLKSQRAIHYVVGWERLLKPGLKLTSEIYFKDLDNLIPYYFDEIKMVYQNGNTREGYSYGLDLQVDGEIIEGTRSILSYSYLNSKERDKGTAKYRRRLADQNHTINLFLQDKMPKHPNWQSHLRFLLGSGLLYYNRNIVEDESTGTKTIQVDLDNPKEFYLYFRVDMGLSASFELGNNIKLTGVAEVLNVFNQYNYGSYDWMQVFDESEFLVAIPRVLSKRFFNFRLQLSI